MLSHILELFTCQQSQRHAVLLFTNLYVRADMTLVKFLQVHRTNKFMLNEVLSTNDALNWKTEWERLSSSTLWAQLWKKKFHSERITEQNPDELLLAYISENGFLYISTTHTSLFVLTRHHFYSKRLSDCNLVCISHKGPGIIWYYIDTNLHTYKNLFVFDGN